MNLSEDQILNGLNETQKKAIMTTEGPVLIVAGPGTGKTLTIVRRIAYLIHQGVNSENILAVTFTNRAAREMRERTEALLGKDAGKVFIGTFHMIGLTIIKHEYSNNFVIYNREEQINLLKKLIKDYGVRKFSRGAQGISERISRIKNYIEDLDDGIRDIYEKYQYTLKNIGALDFDDLILKPIEILSNSEMAKKYRDTFRYIMVDEYQDINRAQYILLTRLAEHKGNLCVIGDSDQAIYAFRGADIENFLTFEKDFYEVNTIKLKENYRATGVILNASNILIKNNQKRIDKSIKQTREKGVPIIVLSIPDERSEGGIIVREIEERIGGTSHYQMMKTKETKDFNTQYSYSFSDFAVIYRTNAQAKAIEESFKTSGIPYQIVGGNYHLKRAEIMKVLAFLRAIHYPSDQLTIDLQQKELDDITRERFKGLLETMPLEEFLTMLWQESNVKNYCSEENFMLLLNLTPAYRDMNPEEVLSSFIAEVSLLTPVDAFDPRADAVALMTFHMAKGLEFKVVFITGVENEMVPYTIKKNDVDIEEERRLFYVGMTRAMDELFLIHSRNRFLYGQRLAQKPSSFLTELPEGLITKRYMPDRIKMTKNDKQIGLF